MRRNIENIEVQTAMRDGEIVPSALFEEIVLPVLSDPKYRDKPLILSEVGRLEGEQQVITRAAQSTGHTQKAVILLNLPQEEVFKRFEAAQEKLDRGDRDDDRLGVLQTRLDNYQTKVSPVIQWYKDQGLLVEIDGTLPPEEVTNQILSRLESLALQDQ